MNIGLRGETPILLERDLIFQVIDWRGGDEPSTLLPGDVWPVDWKKTKEETEEDEIEEENVEEQERQRGSKIHVIRLFGVTREGHSVCVHVRDFQPYIYVKPPAYLKWTQQNTQFLFQWFKRLTLQKPYYFHNSDLISIEMEMRKNFIGFRQEQQEPFLKFTFRNFSSCRTIARFLDEQKIVFQNQSIQMEVFEANIEPMIRYIHQQNISPVGWVILKHGEYQLQTRHKKWSSCQIEVEIKNKQVLPFECNDFAPLYIASFDIECTSLDGSFPKPERPEDKIIQIGTTVYKYSQKEPSYKFIFTLGECDPIEGSHVVSCKTEKELLMKWFQLIRMLDPDILTGYNIWGFDWVYIQKRCKLLHLETIQLGRLIGRPAIWTERTLSSSALGDNYLKFFDCQGRVQIDLLKVVQNGPEKLDMYKLDFVANHFLKLNKMDLTPKELFRKYDSGTPAEIREIAIYCIQDCALVNQLINKLEIITNNAGMGNVCFVPLSWLFLRGQGVKIFSLVARQCRNENFCVPWIRRSIYWRRRGYPQVSEESSYEGAIVLVATPGIYLDPIFVMDYNSLYPNSMIAENISHDSVVWFRIYDLQNELIYEWGDTKQDNLPDYNYWNIEFDNFIGEGDKKETSGKTIVRYSEHKNGTKNVIPRILDNLLKARKNTRKQMELKTFEFKTGEIHEGWVLQRNTETIEILTQTNQKIIFLQADILHETDKFNAFQLKILDGLQSAYKVTANSLYGQVGASTSPICMKELAASTTATGRRQLNIAREFVESEYPGCSCIYGDTDSVFIRSLPYLQKKYGELSGKEALVKAMELGQEVSKRISNEKLKKPQNLAYEKTLWPFIQLAKKRYVGNLYETNPDHCKLKYMGIVLKRRDNANIVKKIYGGMISCLINEQNLEKAIAFFCQEIKALLNGNVDSKELIITKTLKGNYKNRQQIAHAVLADRMGERDPGNKPSSNERIPFIYIEPNTTQKKILQGDRIEHPDWIQSHPEILPDFRYYYEHQVKVPCIQLLALVLEKLPGYRIGWWEQWVQWMDTQNITGKRREHKTADLREQEVEHLLCRSFLHEDDANKQFHQNEIQTNQTIGQLSISRFTISSTQTAQTRLNTIKERIQKEQEDKRIKEEKKTIPIKQTKTLADFWNLK